MVVGGLLLLLVLLGDWGPEPCQSLPASRDWELPWVRPLHPKEPAEHVNVGRVIGKPSNCTWHIPFPELEDPAVKRNVVFGPAMGYTVLDMSVFITSFQMHVDPAQTDLVLLTKDDSLARTWPFKAENVYIIVCDWAGVPASLLPHPQSMRHILGVSFCDTFGDRFGKFLNIDTRDVLFQGSPFGLVTSKAVYFTLEGFSPWEVMGQEHCHTQWARACFPTKKETTITKVLFLRRPVNSGIVFGTTAEVSKFLTHFLKHLIGPRHYVHSSSRRCYKVCNDQIMLNFVVYVTPQPVPARFLYNVINSRRGEHGRILNLGWHDKNHIRRLPNFLTAQNVSTEVVLRNNDGTIPYVLHAWDRYKILHPHVQHLYQLTEDFSNIAIFTNPPLIHGQGLPSREVLLRDYPHFHSVRTSTTPGRTGQEGEDEDEERAR
mmetsp:Transcript_151664/g.265001  ORF Transcript_151664/g.265001 Transcript_151664/m.265001 type:complete len:432 (-) Transcript_151664:1312-2607(-)